MLITRTKPEMFLEKWDQFLKLPLMRLLYVLLGGVAAEEIVFRWVPLVVLYPLWGTNLSLWIIITIASLVFGLMHIGNQKPGKRKPIFVLPQIIGGIVLSYLFSAFGLMATIITHLIFDVILIVVLWVSYRIYPNGLVRDNM